MDHETRLENRRYRKLRWELEDILRTGDGSKLFSTLHISISLTDDIYLREELQFLLDYYGAAPTLLTLRSITRQFKNVASLTEAWAKAHG